MVVLPSSLTSQPFATLGTNSETHTLAVDAVPFTGLLMNATWYLYRPHEAATGTRRQYQNRLRLNAMVTL